jgi:hypothetical protein
MFDLEEPVFAVIVVLEGDPLDKASVICISLLA